MATSFPWDVALTAASTLVAGLGAAWLTVWITRHDSDRLWRREAQARAADDLLSAGSVVYLELRRAVVASGPGADRVPARIDWTAWNAALTRVHLVADSTLAASARSWDEAVWTLSRSRSQPGSLTAAEWTHLARPFSDAQRAFVNAARAALGAESEIERLTGKPELDVSPD